MPVFGIDFGAESMIPSLVYMGAEARDDGVDDRLGYWRAGMAAGG